MVPSNRREFLSDVGRGMLAAGLGTSLAADLGFSTAFAAEESRELSFGRYDALVDLLQQTPPQELQGVLVSLLRRGETDPRQLIAAGALANAETFGGQDYVGFHTAMALLPALDMASLLPADRRPLPILKVLYRNAQQIQEVGGASHKTLQELHEAEHAPPADVGLAIRDAARRTDMHAAEQLFGTLRDRPALDAFNALQSAVQDEVNVHRYVFAHRTYGLAKLLGAEYAHTLLRQCVRFCVHHEKLRVDNNRPESALRTVLPRLLDEHHLVGRPLGDRDPGDDAVDALSRTIYLGPPERSAEAVAAALAEGLSPEVVGEAISLASNRLVLGQGADKPRTHGDAAGVHSTDATNAWRNIARVTTPDHAVAGLIVAAYHSASHTHFQTDPYPTAEHRAAIRATDAAALLAEAEDAVRHNDQGRAAAAIQVYGEQGHSPENVYTTLLKYTISEDGRLHGEKFFTTVREEFLATRPAFRWRHIVGLARVTASAYGYDRKDQAGFRAPGYEEACGLLGVTT
jgi:hypothetical protein